VAATFRLHHIDGFYAVYGGLLNHIILHTSDIVLGYVSHLGNPPPVFELIPTGPNSAYAVIFVYTKSLIAPRSLAATFEENCRHNPFFHVTDHTTRSNEKSGAIPIGRARRRKLKGVISVGEAGLIQPPLMGTAFNEVLEHSETVCSRVSEIFENTSG